MTLRHLDLFSGIGCTPLGMRLAGLDFRTIMYCENDEYCQKVLRARMADGALDDAPIHDDVRTLTRREVALEAGVDIISAGFP